MTIGINLTYEQLVTDYPPRPITSEEQFWQTQARIDGLVDKESLSADEEDYLDALGMMIAAYEAQHEPDIALRGVALIRALMAENNLRQRDLVKPVFKTDSIASTVLNGKRRLTVEHINQLARYFMIPHEYFFEVAT
ncbi:MAG: transcriptional regulator [Chloroflexi bacterium]|nr:transcriptional regulator [Chloroflexota bacterium]